MTLAAARQDTLRAGAAIAMVLAMLVAITATRFAPRTTRQSSRSPTAPTPIARRTKGGIR